jgi:UDP-GlcNAc:undecaprenyl-phosphate/decaprenyl-phosphate GlcNAc-1-phosphate transferase
MTLIGVFFVALSVTFVVSFPLPGFLRKLSVVDVPNERSSHTTPTPRGGGWAVAIGLFAGIATFDSSRPVWTIASLSLLCGAIGFADDVHSLRATFRLAAQLCIGLFGGWSLSRSFPPEQLISWPKWIALPVIMLWVASNINAVNFMDGINGITATHTAISGAFFWFLSDRIGEPKLAIAAAAISGASVGFLPHNAVKARLFLGDVGSYLIGSYLAFLGGALWILGTSPLLVLAPASVYLADTGWTLVVRLNRGESLLEAHREHVYQRLARKWQSHTAAFAVYGTIQALICLAGVSCTFGTIAPEISIAVSVLLVVGYLTSPAWPIPLRADQTEAE